MESLHATSYVSISNLSVTSNFLQRLVAKQLVSHMKGHDLMPRMQSAYRSGHSIETAVTKVKVLSDILIAIDRVDFAALALLDLTAAFDTADHNPSYLRLRCKLVLFTNGKSRRPY